MIISWPRYTKCSKNADSESNLSVRISICFTRYYPHRRQRVANPPEPVEDHVHRRIMYQELHRAIAQLPEIQRKRLLLYYFGGYTYEQIARMEGCKHPAIMKSVSAAEKNIKNF